MISPKQYRMLRRIVITCISVLISVHCTGQKLASFEVSFTKETRGLDIPVSVNLDQVTFVSDTLLTLFEIIGKTKSEIPFQVEQGNPRRIHWMVSTGSNSSENHLFELHQGKTVYRI
jgi:hypothetical protein